MQLLAVCLLNYRSVKIYEITELLFFTIIQSIRNKRINNVNKFVINNHFLNIICVVSTVLAVLCLKVLSEENAARAYVTAFVCVFLCFLGVHGLHQDAHDGLCPGRADQEKALYRPSISIPPPMPARIPF